MGTTSQPKKRKKKYRLVFTPLPGWGLVLPLLLMAALSGPGCGDRSPPPLWPQPPPPTLSEPIGVDDDGDGVQAAVTVADAGGGAEQPDAAESGEAKAPATEETPTPDAKESAGDAKAKEAAQ